MTHEDLVRVGSRWLNRRCSVVFCEFSSAAYENPDVVGWAMGHSMLLECKSSRGDFLRDKNKTVRRVPRMGIGGQRFYLCPSGVISVEDLPAKWGLLWTNGRQVFIKRESDGFPERSLASEIRFLVSMLRRAQVRIGTWPLSEWLRWENRYEAGKLPTAKTLPTIEEMSGSIDFGGLVRYDNEAGEFVVLPEDEAAKLGEKKVDQP